jgi:flap endonuclease-1
MGIKHLHEFLKKTGNIIQTKSNNSYYGKIIAIDISMLLYKIVIGIRKTGNDLLNCDKEIVSHIIGLYDKTMKFLEMGIKPIFVFDGKPPELKNKIINNRKFLKKKAQNKLKYAQNESEKLKYFKRTVHITRQQMNECMELLNLMGLPVIQAPEEADSQCAYLVKNNFADIVLSNDTDILVLGASRIITSFGKKNNVVSEIDLQKILEVYEISYEQFIDMCILFGCDYNQINNLDYRTAFHLIKKYGSIDEIPQNILIKENLNYEKIREYFKNPQVLEIDKLNLKLRNPNYEKLNEFLTKRFKLSEKKINHKILKLKKIFETKVEYIFDDNSFV